MKTSPVTVADLRRSVLAVPPLCHNDDGTVSVSENARLVGHLRAGGVTTHMWGGNANMYGVGVSDFPAFLDMAESVATGDEWAIPSIGAEYGKAMDQARILSGRAFPTAMLLPMRGVADRKGVARGIGRIAAAMGKPLIVYYKDIGYLDMADLKALFADGTLCALKYGVLVPDPAIDPELSAILATIDRDLVISGSGELPVVAHAQTHGLRAFTSGCVCIAPKQSMAILDAITRGDFAAAMAVRKSFLPLEYAREQHSPIRVLHAAVALAGVARTGPIAPMLSDLTDTAVLEAVGREAKSLRAANDRPASEAAE